MAVNFPVYQPPDTSGAIAQGQQDATRAQAAPMSLANMLDEHKMSQLTLAHAERQEADQTKAQEILRGVDYSSPEGMSHAVAELSRAGLGQHAMDLMRFGQQYQSGEHQQYIDKLDTAARIQDVVANELDIVTANLDAQKQANPGMKSDELDKRAAPLVKETLERMKMDHPEMAQQIAQWERNPGIFTYAGLKEAERLSNHGQALLKQQIEMARLNQGQQRVEIADRSEREKEKHDREEAEAARRRAPMKAMQVRVGTDKDGKPIVETHWGRETATGLVDTGESVAPGKGGQQSAITARMMTRINNSANEAVPALQSMARLGGSRGIFAEPGDGVLGSIRGFSTTELQRMQQTILSGLSQEMVAARELGSSTQTDPQIAETLRGLEILPTDTVRTAQFKIAYAARTLRKSLDAVGELGNDQQKERAKKLQKELEGFPDPDVISNAKPGDNLFPNNVAPYKPEDETAAAAAEKYRAGAGRQPAHPGTPTPDRGPSTATFGTEADAEAAAKAGKIKPGDRITVGGKTGTWH